MVLQAAAEGKDPIQVLRDITQEMIDTSQRILAMAEGNPDLVQHLRDFMDVSIRCLMRSSAVVSRDDYASARVTSCSISARCIATILTTSASLTEGCGPDQPCPRIPSVIPP